MLSETWMRLAPTMRSFSPIIPDMKRNPGNAFIKRGCESFWRVNSRARTKRRRLLNLINSCHPIPHGSGRRNEQRSIMTIGRGVANKYLSGDALRQIVTQAFESHKLEGKRVIILIPDGTRTMPMPQMFALFQQILRPRVKALDYLVALGTHPIMGDQQLSKLVGHQVVNGKCGDTNVFNHHWEDPATFANLGTIPAAEIAKITSGRMSQDVPVTLNKLILDYDHIIICGPVFPHDVVG